MLKSNNLGTQFQREMKVMKMPFLLVRGPRQCLCLMENLGRQLTLSSKEEKILSMIPTCGCFSVVLGTQLSLIFMGQLFASELKQTQLTFLQGTQGDVAIKPQQACRNSLETTQSILYWFSNLAYTTKKDNCKEKLFSVSSLGLAPFCFVIM